MKRKAHGKMVHFLPFSKEKYWQWDFFDNVGSFKTSGVRNLQNIFIHVYQLYGWVFFENCGCPTIKASCH